MIRACGHAVTASETTLRYLSDNSGVRIDINSILRADRQARCLFLALLTEHRNEHGIVLFKRTVLRDIRHAKPGDTVPAVHLLDSRRDVILNSAGDRACTAAVAFIQIDHHAVFILTLIRRFHRSCFLQFGGSEAPGAVLFHFT